MNRFFEILFAAMFAIAFVLPMNSIYAVGTIAGTILESKATVTFTTGTFSSKKESNFTTIMVAKTLNVTVTWQDAADVLVEPGEINKKLLFKVTNTGNGSEAFVLTALSILVGNQFDPTLNLISIDNGDGKWNPAQDLQYNPDKNPIIKPDAFIYVWVDNSIPTKRPETTDILDGDIGKSQLTATSVTVSSAKSTITKGISQDGIDAVVGKTKGTATISGNYIASSVIIAVLKTASVVNPAFDDKPVPGAEIDYTITVQVTSGSGSAKSMIIKDPIPTGTTYKPGSITLNTVGKTDSADDDGCDYNSTNANAVTVQLGDMTVATSMQTIKFKVTVN